MSMLPWGMMFGGGLSPYNNDSLLYEPIDPRSLVATIDRPMRRMERRMERELGKMISGVQEDDKTFQVIMSFIMPWADGLFLFL